MEYETALRLHIWILMKDKSTKNLTSSRNQLNKESKEVLSFTTPIMKLDFFFKEDMTGKAEPILTIEVKAKKKDADLPQILGCLKDILELYQNQRKPKITAYEALVKLIWAKILFYPPKTISPTFSVGKMHVKS